MFPVTDLYLPGLAPIQSLPPRASWAFARGTSIDTSTNTPIIRNMLWDSHWARPLPVRTWVHAIARRLTPHAVFMADFDGAGIGKRRAAQSFGEQSMRGRPYRSAFRSARSRLSTMEPGMTVRQGASPDKGPSPRPRRVPVRSGVAHCDPCRWDFPNGTPESQHETPLR